LNGSFEIKFFNDIHLILLVAPAISRRYFFCNSPLYFVILLKIFYAMNFIITGQIILMLLLNAVKQKDFETDIFKTSDGELTITFIGHGTLIPTPGFY